MNNDYIGHSQQLSGVEVFTLERGKGKGMTLLQIRNGKGMDFTLSADRCMDISRLYFSGVNLGYFSPCGYVAPAYYDDAGAGFLKSFTAGFLTTCGFSAVGSPCTDDGEDLPLHGTISNTPCENYSYQETDTEIRIDATVRDASLFGKKYLLHRTYICSKTENILTLQDTIENIDSKPLPCMILYHCNFGYPLLSENAKVAIPAASVVGRNDHAQKDIDACLVMEKPQGAYEEECFYHAVNEINGIKQVGIFNPDIQKGLVMEYQGDTLPFFTQWKMMGKQEYVLGLEPGNCTPDGRDVMRQNGTLPFINPGENYQTTLTFKFIDTEDSLPR